MATTLIGPRGIHVDTQLVLGKGCLNTYLMGSNPIPFVPGAPSTILAGSKSVALIATPEPLAPSTTSTSVTIKAKTANTGIIKVGNATTQNVELTSGESVSIDIDDLNKIYLAVTVNGEGVDYVGEA